MIAFREANVYPDMVQVGNEISNGMIWPYGKLPENWDSFAALIKAGINGVYASIGNNKHPKIMIHIDKGGDNTAPSNRSPRPKKGPKKVRSGDGDSAPKRKSVKSDGSAPPKKKKTYTKKDKKK